MTDTDDKPTKGLKRPSTKVEPAVKLDLAVKVTLAVIGLIGTLGVALFANWHNIFSQTPQTPQTPQTQSQPVEQPRTTVARLPAPVPQPASCDVTIPWPAQTHFMIVSWEQVSGASYYSVEMDCLGCGGGVGWFSLREDRPWHLREELGLRARPNVPAIYSSDIHVRLRREGGRALRWRVWGVDHDGVDSDKSRWCRISFFG